MPDGLSVIRRLMGLAAPRGPAPQASGGPSARDAAEAALLSQSLQALGALPAAAPSESVLARVMARAAEASEVGALAPVRGALGLGPAQAGAEAAVLTQSLLALDALPRLAPEPSALDAVYAEAVRATYAPLLAASGEGEANSPETALLAQSLQALDAVPARAPEAETVAAVEGEALRATYAPLLAASGEGTAKGPEVAVLTQSLRALDALPAPAPDASVLAAVEARAADATVAPVLAVYGETASGEAIERGAASAEAALLAPSREALDALPRHAPTPAALAAVLAFAAEASGEAVSTTASAAVPVAAVSTTSRPRARRAADRTAVAPGAGRRRVGLFAGFGTLAVALIAAVVLLRSGPELAAPEVAADLDAVAEAAPAPAAPAPLDEEAEPLAAAPAAPSVASAPEAVAPFAAAAPPPVASRRAVPRGPSADGFEAAAAREVVRQTSRARAAAPAPASFAATAGAGAAADEAAPEATAWEAGDDVRLLSLRLQQLREQNAGIEWDEPAAPFGQASGAAAGTTPGVQAVREGVPVGRALVRTPAPADSNRR